MLRQLIRYYLFATTYSLLLTRYYLLATIFAFLTLGL